MRAAIVLISLMLAACGSTSTVVKEQVRTVSVPVIQKCAAERPAEVEPLRDRVDEAAWQEMSLKQKAETTAAQALRRLSYSAALAAATSAC